MIAPGSPVDRRRFAHPRTPLIDASSRRRPRGFAGRSPRSRPARASCRPRSPLSAPRRARPGTQGCSAACRGGVLLLIASSRFASTKNAPTVPSPAFLTAEAAALTTRTPRGGGGRTSTARRRRTDPASGCAPRGGSRSPFSFSGSASRGREPPRGPRAGEGGRRRPEGPGGRSRAREPGVAPRPVFCKKISYASMSIFPARAKK